MSNQPLTLSNPDTQLMIEEYTSWHAQILERVFYPHDMAQEIVVQPSFLISWLEEADERGKASAALLTLKQLHNDFISQGQNCLGTIPKAGNSPDYKNFKKLNILFEELLKYITSLNFHASGDQRYMDERTGLGTQRALERDLQVEMERFTRHGKQFALALVKIHDYADLESGLPETEFTACLNLTGNIIRKSIRSFDDAYYLGEGRFALCLKHSNNSEGIRALSRLKNELKKKNMIYNVSNGPVTLRVSSCITEPVPGDELSVILEDLEQDLQSHSGEPTAVLEHHEISPLQRFLKDSA
ncbi:MAG: diguanylate cyclase domain-containing protein [Alphaproteobacteria bacterium]